VLTLDANVWVAAFDSRDRFHNRSTTFLRAAAVERLDLHGPAFVAVEVACALARRAGNPSVGGIVHERLHRHPALDLYPMDDRCLSRASEIGIQRRLRGADALYAAVAELAGAQLITWDDELIERAGALTPDTWLADRNGPVDQ
jgi:predicted nucleic acid-binding protein